MQYREWEKQGDIKTCKHLTALLADLQRMNIKHTQCGAFLSGMVEKLEDNIKFYHQSKAEHDFFVGFQTYVMITQVTTEEGF